MNSKNFSPPATRRSTSARTRIYGFKINKFELSSEGAVSYAQWLHPRESKKIIQQDAVDELKKFLAPGDAAIDIGAHTDLRL